MKRYVCLIILLGCFVGCSIIDDDLSVCGSEYDLLYEMKLVTNVQMAVDEKLSDITEQPIADSLKQWLAPMFSGQAHDLHMNFYADDAQGILKQQRYEIINASQKSYTLTIPRENYMHLAVANLDNNANMRMTDAQYAPSLCLTQQTGDTLDSHTTAVYTARLPMHMQQEGDTTFDVHLYMVSCAVALVITKPLIGIPPLRVFLNGVATGFHVKDSVYTYDHARLIRAERIMDNCYTMVALPSRDSIAATTELPKRMIHSATPALWELKTYVTMPDGKVTETILSVNTPLKAGTLEIIKVQLNDDGSVTPIQTTQVGASVTLDWKEGTNHEVEI